MDQDWRCMSYKKLVIFLLNMVIFLLNMVMFLLTMVIFLQKKCIFQPAMLVYQRVNLPTHGSLGCVAMDVEAFCSTIAEMHDVKEQAIYLAQSLGGGFFGDFFLN